MAPGNNAVHANAIFGIVKRQAAHVGQFPTLGGRICGRVGIGAKAWPDELITMAPFFWRCMTGIRTCR